jgi:hypothetical protein
MSTERRLIPPKRLNRKPGFKAVLLAMRNRGLALHRHHTKHGLVEWSLSDGTLITDHTARILIDSPQIVAVDDGLPLPGGAIPQTFRLVTQ